MVTKQELRWISGFTIFTIIITSIPYLLGYINQGVNWRFTGFFIGVEDGNTYIANMQNGYGGEWLFRTSYTPYPQQGIIAFLPYILLGKFTFPPAQHEQMVALFHIYRIFSIVALIFATYLLLTLYIKNIRYRKFGVFLSIFGGGLGWLLLLLGLGEWLGSYPLEFYSPERFGFLEVFTLPHLIAARACLLFALVIYLKSKTWKGGISAGLLLFLASIFQPLTALTGCLIIASHLGVSGLWLAFKKGIHFRTERGWIIWENYFIKGILAVIISSPILIQMAIVSAIDPFVIAWNTQSQILSPHPLQYLVAYFPILPFAIIGGIAIGKSKFWIGTLPIGWLLIFPILAYLPHNVQRRLPEAVWIAFIILGMFYLERGVKWLSARLRNWGEAIYLLLLSLSTITMLTGSIGLAVDPRQPVFRPTYETKAYQELGYQVSGFPVVLATYSTSNALPAWAPVRVVAGLYPLSQGAAINMPKQNSFFEGKMDFNQQRDFLRELNVSYIYWGPAEKELGNWKPDPRLGLRTVYDQDNIQIFRVDNITNTQK